MTGMRLVASAMKNEAPYILEWVAYNRLIGFDAIVIGSNDSSDGTDEILTALAHNGIIHHIVNTVGASEAPQHAFYGKVQKLAIFNQIEWLAIIDADEFINIHVGDGRLDDLFAAMGKVDIAQLNWAVFGDAGQPCFSREPVIERFTRRIAEQHRINAGCKCLTRKPRRFEHLRNHNPVRFRGGKPRLSVYHGGEVRKIPADSDLTDALQYTAAEGVSFKVAQINHYAIKTRPEYALRQLRGNGALPANQPGRQRYDDRYFSLRSLGDVEDLSILRHATNLKTEIDALARLPGVDEAVRSALDLHRAQLEQVARAQM